jgi:hypothetical protein
VATGKVLVFGLLIPNSHARPALFGVGAAALLRLFIGIHNAWETVTHLVFVRKRKQHEASQTAVK